MITLKANDVESKAMRQDDYTYAADLKAGTYSMEIRSPGFCALRRANFSLDVGAVVEFKMQMWVCGSHSSLIQYAELDEVPVKQLKPLVLYGRQETDGLLLRFRGAHTLDDGTHRARQYPAILTLDLMSIEADEIEYNMTTRMVTAIGHVAWRDGDKLCVSNKVELRLDESPSKIVPSTK